MRSLMMVTALAVLLSVAPAWGQEKQAGQQIELTGAVIKEQNVTFAVVIVKSEILQNRTEADSLIHSLEPTFGGIPVVLMMQDAKGTPSYYGRDDIAHFLANVPVDKIPWKKYTLSSGKQ